MFNNLFLNNVIVGEACYRYFLSDSNIRYQMFKFRNRDIVDQVKDYYKINVHGVKTWFDKKDIIFYDDHYKEQRDKIFKRLKLIKTGFDVNRV